MTPRHRHPRLRAAFLVIGLLLLVLVPLAGGVALFVGRFGLVERVYAPDEIATGLQQRPRSWIGRAVLVNGVVISYAYYRHGPGGANAAGQSGCYFHNPQCARATRANLSMAPSGSVIRIVLAARVRNFTFQGNPGQIVPQHPANTLSVGFHAPLFSDTLPPLLRQLRRWPAIAPMLPPLRSGVAGPGLYRVRIVDAWRRHRNRPWQVDAVLLDVR